MNHTGHRFNPKKGRSMPNPLKPISRVAAAALLACPSTVMAEDWTFAASFYLFAAETETTVGNVSSTLSFKDALDNLDMAFMGSLEARNGRWGILGDYMLTDLSFGNSVSGQSFDTINTSLKTQILSAYAAYRVYEDQTLDLDLAAGARWFKTDTQLRLLSGPAEVGRADANESWVDPVVGVRANVALSDRWSGTVFADYGGFRSDSETWQVLVTADFAMSPAWTLRAGYRLLSVDHDINGRDFKFKQSGPILGATFRF